MRAKVQEARSQYHEGAIAYVGFVRLYAYRIFIGGRRFAAFTSREDAERFLAQCVTLGRYARKTPMTVTWQLGSNLKSLFGEHFALREQ